MIELRACYGKDQKVWVAATDSLELLVRTECRYKLWRGGVCRLDNLRLGSLWTETTWV
jgi:hypothetical protein